MEIKARKTQLKGGLLGVKTKNAESLKRKLLYLMNIILLAVSSRIIVLFAKNGLENSLSISTDVVGAKDHMPISEGEFTPSPRV